MNPIRPPATTPHGLKDALEMTLRQTMDQYGIDDAPGETIPMRFASLIRALHAATGRQVAEVGVSFSSDTRTIDDWQVA